MKKLTALLISLICLLSAFGSTLGVSAEALQPRAPEESSTAYDETTGNDFGGLKPTTTKPAQSTTAPETEKQTEEQKEEPTTQKKDSPTTTRKNTGNSDNSTTTRADRPAQATQPAQSTTAAQTTTEPETLPGGAFYVYVEKNNGEPRLKRVMTGKDVVPEPEMPIRIGYLFKGWYADPEFKTPWNFYKDMADIGTVIYAKWELISDGKEYKITVNALQGGKIEVNPSPATAGEYVSINVLPDEGKRLIVGSVTVNGEATDVLGFVMPEKNVEIFARFEDIPEDEKTEEKSNKGFFIIAGVVAALVVICIVVLSILRRRNEISEDEIDENGTIIDNDDDDWYDETIVVEDGFREGEKVVGNFVPEEEIQAEPLEDEQ